MKSKQSPSAAAVDVPHPQKKVFYEKTFLQVFVKLHFITGEKKMYIVRFVH